MLYSLDLIILKLKYDTIITGQVIKKKNIYKASLLVGELDPVPRFPSRSQGSVVKV